MADDIVLTDELLDDILDDWPYRSLTWTLANEVVRLRAELEQANLNLQHARTGKALLDLEQERARTAHLRSAFAELTELCQRLLTERFNDMTEGVGDTPTSTPTPNLTRIDL